MTKISQYKLNSHFTALKQLPQLYGAQVSHGAESLAQGTIGKRLFSTTINVPAGVYVEIAAVQSTLDGNIVHLAHSYTYQIGNLSRVYYQLNQIFPNQYEFAGYATALDNGTTYIPAGTARVSLALSMAPF